MWVAVLVMLIAVLFLLLSGPTRFSSSGGRKRGKMAFYIKGVDAGFAISEINLLWSAAVRADISNPSALYGSFDELDKTINQIAGKSKFQDRKQDDPDTLILKKLFEYRKKMEMNKPKYRMGLKSTRSVDIGQRLSVRGEGLGNYSSKVVENEPDYLSISIPVGDPLPRGFSWRQATLNIYFWRKEDAGYYFQTRVIGNYYNRKNLSFRVKHSDTLLRSQRRKTLRAPARISARYYPLASLNDANQWIESAPGHSCLIIDISDEGVALQASGRIKKNQALKLQFKIRDEIVVVAGIVKRAKYNSKENSSILHVGFSQPTENAQMILLSYVFDIDRSRAKGGDMETEDVLNTILGFSSASAEGAIESQESEPNSIDDEFESPEIDNADGNKVEVSSAHSESDDDLSGDDVAELISVDDNADFMPTDVGELEELPEK